MKELRVWWAGDELGWIIDTPLGLAPWEIERCRIHTLKIQEDRYISLPHGEKKDECLRTIQALHNKKIQQNIIGTGDKVIFDAYKSDGRKIFHP